jgi:hypothetical protein
MKAFGASNNEHLQAPGGAGDAILPNGDAGSMGLRL